MPFVFNPFDEDEDKKQEAGQSNIISGSSNTFSNQQSSAPIKTEKASGSFTNLNKYLDANKEQASEMGNKIADSVESQAVKANDSINALKTNAPSAVNKFNADDWFANPDASKKDPYQTLKNTGGYSGPDSVEKINNYSSYQTDVNKADQNVKNIATETGRFNLLQDTYKRPQYSQGMQKLDNSLIQRNDESKARFEDINNKYKNILDLFNTESENAGKKINDNISQAYQNKQDLLSAESNAKKNLINPIQERANQLNQSNPEVINRVNNDLSDDTLNDETLGLLGLSDGQGLYDLKLNSYVNPNQTQVGLDNAATAEERAKYAALASMIDDPTMTQITSEGKAIKPVSFNKEQFDKDFGAKQAEYNKALQDYRTPSTTIYFPNGGKATYLGGQSIAELEKLKATNGGSLHPQLQEILDNFYNKYQPNRKVTRG